MAADPAVLAEIARLSGLVNRQKYGLAPPYDAAAGVAGAGYAAAYSRPYRGRGGRGGPSRGQYQRGGGGARGGRGRGGGASTTARQHGNSVWTPSTASSPLSSSSAASTSQSGAAAVAQPAHKSVHRKLVLNNNSNTEKSATATPFASTSATPIDEPMASTSSASIVADKTPLSSIRPEEPEEGEIEQTVEERTNAKINPGREVIINGITFIADAKGKKLVRKSSSAVQATASNATASTSTPSKTSIDGQSYVRTKSGNLISSDLVKKREMEAKKKRLDHLVGVIKGVQKARGQGRSTAANKKLEQQRKTLCRFFQKTGKAAHQTRRLAVQLIACPFSPRMPFLHCLNLSSRSLLKGVCTRGLTCPYLHDSAKISICPRFIRNSCPLPSSKCPLSHVPNAHRMPHCLHFPYCTRGDACLYSHVHVSPTAKVCKDFVLLGWCEKGLECKERHVWECPDFSEKGTCKRKGCKLPHVIRKGSIEGEDDASLFVKDVVGTLKAAAASSASGQAEVEHSLPNPDDKGKKRALEQDEDEEADSSADEVEGELLNNHKKKQKIAFNPDAVQANEDFVTLMISDTDEGSEEEDDSAENEEESSVADSEDDNDKDEEVQQAGISHVFTTSTAAKGSFARRAERGDDDSDDVDIEEDE